MRITEGTDSKKFVDEIEIPDADDVELAPGKSADAVVRSADEAPFAKSYAPETLPKIDVPDLPEDAVSVSTQALSELPSVTELMPLAEIDDSDDEDPISAPALALSAPEPQADAEMLAAIQVKKAEADKRAEIMQARMGKLTGQISSLNDKLDRLANSSKIKV